MTSEMKYDSKGRPMVDQKTGLSIQRFLTDEEGNITGFDPEYWSEDQILGFIYG
jgi:hypothetical protein